MGIAYYFTRITAEDLAELEKIEERVDISRAVIDNIPEDETLEHAYWCSVDPIYRVTHRRSHLQTYTMVPMDEFSPEKACYSFTVEHSYWSLLERLIKQLVRDQVIPYWPLTEDFSLYIGDFSMGHSRLHILLHDELIPLLTMLQDFPYEQLKQRFDDEFVEYTDITEREKQGVYNAVVGCLESLQLMAQQAYAANESIVWYIG
ncbi:hypothetical protein [Herpetosiphon llansteffanensis]|uniref:hypothetical protein n=1 Tax=Herpetosiphon llansteffanensis TaxID=2094568 RepID=UPI000D7CB6BE|nr:hypothetical protein [Herpetosiphon llansteffanensis]